MSTLLDALRWYADPANYDAAGAPGALQHDPATTLPVAFDCDRGHRARVALDTTMPHSLVIESQAAAASASGAVAARERAIERLARRLAQVTADRDAALAELSAVGERLLRDDEAARKDEDESTGTETPALVYARARIAELSATVRTLMAERLPDGEIGSRPCEVCGKRAVYSGSDLSWQLGFDAGSWAAEVACAEAADLAALDAGETNDGDY